MPGAHHDMHSGRAEISALQLEVRRIGGLLAQLAGATDDARLGLRREPPNPYDPGGNGMASAGTCVFDRENPTAAEVRSVIRQRRRREELFEPDLFADPVWDMMLDLYAAALDRKRVSVSSLCIASAVPATTALRWIKLMEQRGLFVRSPDGEDGRRIYIALSADACEQMRRYFVGRTQAARCA
jgi:hypothetical protein